jgi:predicted dehydrogenase
LALKIGLVGCGRIGWLLERDPLRSKPCTHLGALHMIPELFRLTAVCDTDPERLDACSRENGVPGFPDFRELFQSEELDAVIIATPTSSHAGIAAHAIKSGIRGIILEKPVAESPPAARRLRQLARIAGASVIVNHERRYDALYLKCREVIASGEYGALKSLHGRLSSSVSEMDFDSPVTAPGKSPLFHDGTHLVDMARFLCGPLRLIYAYAEKPRRQATVPFEACALLESSSGVRVTLDFAARRGYYGFEIDLQFDAGRIRVGNGLRESWQAEESRRYRGFRELARRDFALPPGAVSPFCGALLDLYRTLTTKDAPVSTLSAAVSSLELLFQIAAGSGIKRRRRFI